MVLIGIDPYPYVSWIWLDPWLKHIRWRWDPVRWGGCCVHAKLPGLGHRYFKDEIHPALKHSVGRLSRVGIPAISVDGASRLLGMVRLMALDLPQKLTWLKLQAQLGPTDVEIEKMVQNKRSCCLLPQLCSQIGETNSAFSIWKIQSSLPFSWFSGYCFAFRCVGLWAWQMPLASEKKALFVGPLTMDVVVSL